MTASLAYRNNEAAILAGDVPEKYKRILPYIPGRRILELGSAEGVLSLLLATEGRDVVAVEKSMERHQSAINLGGHWPHTFVEGGCVRFINARADEALGVLQPGIVDTLVAVRMIYYLRDQIDAVFAMIADKVPNVVLCGNKNRAGWWRQGIPDKEDGAVNYYASADGMRDVLTRHGYEITKEVTDGDPIVVGSRQHLVAQPSGNTVQDSAGS